MELEYRQTTRTAYTGVRVAAAGIGYRNLFDMDHNAHFGTPLATVGIVSSVPTIATKAMTVLRHEQITATLIPRLIRVTLPGIAFAAIAACGGGSRNTGNVGAGDLPASYAISGTVTGLSGSGLVLRTRRRSRGDWERGHSSFRLRWISDSPMT